jgi:hypothetical protein
MLKCVVYFWLYKLHDMLLELNSVINADQMIGNFETLISFKPIGSFMYHQV